MNWKSAFDNIYGNKLYCSVGKPDALVQMKMDGTSDIAVYCNTYLKIAVIWDVKHHRKNKGIANTLSYSKNWSDIKLSNDGLDCDFKTFRTENGLLFEKILIVSFDTLEKIKHDLYEFLRFDIDDTNISQVTHRDNSNTYYEWTNDKNRERVSISTWKRNQRFRKIVLENYNYKCAICGCAEEKILEAAHINAVKNGGKDILENGICLCRNHHKMFDEKLIMLNFENHSIYDVKPSVKKFVNENLIFSFGNHEKSFNNQEEI